jgi:hypothetical protein
MSIELASRQQDWREGAWVILSDGQAWSFPPIECHRRKPLSWHDGGPVPTDNAEPLDAGLVWFLGGRSADTFGFCAERLAAAPPGAATEEDTRHLFALALLHNYVMTTTRAAELVAAGAELEAAVLAPALAAARNPR